MQLIRSQKSDDCGLKNLVLQVATDSNRLYRAIANLIHNAIQYTPTNGVVNIRLESAERNAIITIKDNGIGIAAADLSHIFDRFYRVQADRSRNTGGTGLGLAIVKAIVQAHHGSIKVDSQLDLGSTFTVTLPTKATPSKISSQNQTI